MRTNLFRSLVTAIMILICMFLNWNSFSQYKKSTLQKWKGIASYYHPKFNGRKTSNGEIFSNTKLTCANNFLKLGTYIKVLNPKNGKSVVVKVNDRMSKHNRRLVDLSQAAAKELGLLHKGLGEVSIEVMDKGYRTLALN